MFKFLPIDVSTSSSMGSQFEAAAAAVSNATTLE